MNMLPDFEDAPIKEAPDADLVVAGFKASAASAGLRDDGRVDLALIAAERPVNAAAVFTRSKLPAAPVQVGRENIKSGCIRAILANSAGANAATGQAGLDACRKTIADAASALGCEPEEIIPCSTGVIGQLLNADKVGRAIPGLTQSLTVDGLKNAALAIGTTDVFPKWAEARVEIDGVMVKVAGIAKGAGMIRPDMATMLSFVLTDADVAEGALQGILNQACEQSFNRITVDGHTSTNDTLVLLASGEAGNAQIEAGTSRAEALAEAVTKVCRELATMIAGDGEGAGHVVRVLITGAVDERSAELFAYSIAESQLCKTALAGCDPNWGRFVSAPAAVAPRLGYEFEPESTGLWIGDALVAKGAVWQGAEAEAQAAEVMKRNRYQIKLDLGLGEASYWVLASDLDHEYVKINADYRS